MASNILQNLQKILSSRYGKDVRQAIHDSIHDCYEDGKAGSTDLIAREQIANLVSLNNPTEGNSELQDIRVGDDGTTYKSAGDAVRKQVGSLFKDSIKKINSINTEEFDNYVGHNRTVLSNAIIGHEYIVVSDSHTTENQCVGCMEYGTLIQRAYFHSNRYAIIKPNKEEIYLDASSGFEYTGSLSVIDVTNDEEKKNYIISNLYNSLGNIYDKDFLSVKEKANKADQIDKITEIVGKIADPVANVFISIGSGTESGSYIKLMDATVGNKYAITLEIPKDTGAMQVCDMQYGTLFNATNFENSICLFIPTYNNIYVRANGVNTYSGNIAIFDVTNNPELEKFILENGYSAINELYGGRLDLKPQPAENDIFYFHGVPFLEKDTQKYISSNGSIISKSNYNVFKYSLKNFKNVKIKSKLISNPNTGYRYCFSSDINGNSITRYGSKNSGGWTDNYEEEIDLNENDAYLFVCVQNQTIPSVIGLKKLLNDDISSPWVGKKCVTYGDSITEGEKWQPYLMSRFGFSEIVNCGIGGTYVSNIGSNPFCSLDRIKKIPSDADIVIVMGGTNDEGADVPIGDLEYSEETGFDLSTFKGALAYIIQKIGEQCPNATIFVASPLSGRGNTGENMNFPIQNGIGLYAKDYADAVKAVCNFFSTQYIPVYEECGITPWNRTDYITDTVHPNVEGGVKIAMVMIRYIETYEIAKRLVNGSLLSEILDAGGVGF